LSADVRSLSRRSSNEMETPIPTPTRTAMLTGAPMVAPWNRVSFVEPRQERTMIARAVGDDHRALR
jgi:hypothetical protein